MKACVLYSVAIGLLLVLQTSSAAARSIEIETEDPEDDDHYGEPEPKQRKPPPPKAKRSPPSPLLKKRAPPPKGLKNPPPSPPRSSAPPPCSLTIDGTLTQYKICSTIKRGSTEIGTVYYSLSSSGNVLTVGFKAATTNAGYVAWALSPKGGMIGSSAVFAQQCSSSNCPTSTAKLSSYAVEGFKPSDIAFNSRVAGHAPDGKLAGAATLAWPAGQQTINVLLATGPLGKNASGVKVPNGHYSVPPRNTLSKTDFL